MGARQVLRVALIAGAIGAGAPARGQTIHRAEPVVVIDARDPATPDRDATRARFGDALDRVKGVHVERGGAQDAALAGQGGDDVGDAQASLDVARAAYGALDCAKARPAAEQAALVFAARQAAGISDPAAKQAWAYVLLCADRDGDHGGAAIAASMLRALGVRDAAEASVGADTWAKYPDVDARTAALAEVTVDAEPGADVWIDLAPAGKAPVTATLAAGDHVIAAASGTRRAAARVTVQWSTKTSLALEERGAGSWTDVIAQVRAWQRASAPPEPAAVAALVRSLHVRFAFVLRGDGVTLWGLGPDDQAARVIETGTLDDAASLGAVATSRAAAWDSRAADTDHLLVENRGGGAVKKDHWWVYASLIGAIVVGGVVVYAHDSAQDTQHIELRYP